MLVYARRDSLAENRAMWIDRFVFWNQFLNKNSIYIRYIYGEFLRVFLILEQPTWQHCFLGSAGVVTMLFSVWSKKEASFFLLFGATWETGLLFDAQKGEKPSNVLGFWCHKASFWCAHRKPRKFFASSSQALSWLVSRQMTLYVSTRNFQSMSHQCRIA